MSEPAELDTAETGFDPAAGSLDLSHWLRGRPDGVALSLGGIELSYAELSERVAAAVASLSTDHNPDEGLDLVVVQASESVPTLVACYAALASGRAVLVCDPEQPEPEIDMLPEGAELLVTTSGSTGRPRVIARTWESWRISFQPFTELTGIDPDDAVLLTGELHASMHLFAAMHTLWIGATLTDSSAAATVAHAAPSTLDALIRDEVELRLAIVAGAAMTTGLADRARTLGIEIVEYYGAAELSFVAARRYRRPMTQFPGVEIDVRDGVIWARSPYLSLGYAGQPGALKVDDDGFATVGDLGSFRGETLTVRGRSDAAITTGGSTVIVEDIETVLLAAPGVRAVVVVGLPHERFGQVLAAVLELAPGANGAHVRTYARAQLQTAALPRRWYVAALPRNAAGKVSRTSVRARLLDGTLAANPLP